MFTALSVRCALILVIVSSKVAECQNNCFEDSCYVFEKEEKKWEEARQFCKQRRGDLVSIETIEEWNFIKGMIENQSSDIWFIGLEKKAASWTWVSGRPLTICDWGNNQLDGNGHVARIETNRHTIKSGQGKEKGSFICETTKGIGDSTSEGYCFNHVGISCKLEYGKKSWTQNCTFSAYDCNINCTVSACEPPPGYPSSDNHLLNTDNQRLNPDQSCGKLCAKTFNPLVQQCTDERHVDSTYCQTCNVTKCNLTEGEKNFTTKDTCYCADLNCHQTCSDIRCTQTCRGIENGETLSYSQSLSPSMLPTPSSQTSPIAASSSSLPSRPIPNLVNEYLSKLDRINITQNTSLQMAMGIFEDFITAIESIEVDGQFEMEEEGERREFIFKVAVTFEEIALNYSKLHLVGTKNSKEIDGQKMVLSINKASRQKASGFHLWKEEWQASIDFSSANFADHGLHLQPFKLSNV